MATAPSMTGDTDPTLANADPRDRSLVNDLKGLSETGRAYAQAELAFQKARAAYAAEEARGIAVSGVVAGVLVFFAGMALVLGLVLGLSTVFGPWFATAIVVLVLLGIAFAFLLRARSATARMKTNLADQPGATP